MNINLIEMEGLLRGQCIPGDLLVNETLAEYLVRQFANLNEQLTESRREFTVVNATIHNLELKVEQVVAENAGMKHEVPMGAIENGRAFADRLEAYPFECEGGNLNMCSDWQELRRCLEHLSEWAMHGQDETPATDAAIANIQAQGVDAAIEKLLQKFEGTGHIGVPVMVLESFAAQLRQGAKL